MNHPGRLTGKVAIVTGAAHGIGRAISEIFAEECAQVFLGDVDAEAGEEAAARIRSSGGSAEFIRCDVSNQAEVAAFVKAASQQKNRVDVLCNNAAYLSKEWHGCGEATDTEWDMSWRVSLLGCQHCTRAVLPFMLEQKGGSIINISSIQGLVGARQSVAYTSIKHALIGFTRSVAYDYGSSNIRCNAICPGAIRTRISPAPGSELHQRQVSKTFLGRTGEPRDVGLAALFLASDEASYITGSTLVVDGGWTAM